MKMKAIKLLAGVAFILVTAIGSVYASEDLQPGSRYKTLRPVYLMAIYNSLNNRQLNKETARAYLHSQKYYDKADVAFQCEIPAGTIITIIGTAPNVWHIPFFADRYFIQLTPDLSRGLYVVLELNRGMDGSLDGLNPEIFTPMKN